MRKPLRVKNTDTPRLPPRNQPGSDDVAQAWNSRTPTIDSARRPSMAGSYAMVRPPPACAPSSTGADATRRAPGPGRSALCSRAVSEGARRGVTEEDERPGDGRTGPRLNGWALRHRELLVSVAVGAVLRIGWALYAASSTPEFLVSGDQYSYWVLGQEIGAGHGYRIPPFTTPTSYYPVGWPAILGLITVVTTHTPLPDSSVLWTALWQISMGVVAIALVHRVARATWGVRVAIVAAWIVALWPNLIMSVATYSIESTFLAGMLACVAVLVDHDWSTGAPG